MRPWISNARMYAVTPGVEAAWQQLIEHVAQDAGVSPLTYEAYAAPQPLEVLWRRTDLGCVFMCGYPIALKLADVRADRLADPRRRLGRRQGPLPIRSHRAGRQRLSDAGGHVRRDARLDGRALALRASTPCAITCWVAARTGGGDLYGRSIGSLITARGVLDAVIDGRIDVGPLDGYWHSLIRHHRPDLVAHIRVLDSTDLAPLPAFVASSAAPAAMVSALKDSFARCRGARLVPAPRREHSA